MTVTVAGAVEFVRTDTSDPMTWSHNVGTTSPEGVVVAIIHGTSSTDHVVGVTYGGVALTRIQRNTDTATEPGAAELWFRGDSIPTGTQTVSVDLASGTTDDIHGVSITLDGAGNLEVVDNDGISENTNNPSVTLQYTGRTCLAVAALYGGGAAPSSFTENANCTRVHDHDLGAFYSVVLQQTTAGSSDFAIGGTASNDDVAFAAIAVSEATRRGIVTWAEFEVPNAPRRGIVTWAEFEVPNAPRRGIVTWAEFEVPNAPRRGIVTWAEFEVPDTVPRRGIVTWAEFEVPNAPRRGVVTWAEVEIPNAPRRGIVTWAEFEVPAVGAVASDGEWLVRARRRHRR